MGISLEQYRARIGSFAAKKCKSKDAFDTEVLDPPDIDTSPPTMISISWKTASFGLLLLLLCALCQSQLLLMGGIEPHPGPTTEETLNKRESVIAELVVKADSDTVKNVLRIYKPAMHYNQLQKAFERMPIKPLIETMEFLGVPGCERFVKTSIINRLIRRIKSYFPDECAMCSQEYVVPLGETVLIRCDICEQGVHSRCLAMKLGVAEVELEQMTSEDVRGILYPKSLGTQPYLCGYCYTATIPDPDEGLKKQKTPKPRVNSNAAAIPATTTLTLGDVDSDSVLGPASRTTDPESDGDSSDADTESDKEPPPHSHRKSPLPSRASRTKSKTEDDSSNSKRDKPICSYFRQGQCRHGISGKGCSRAHPKLCHRLMSNGTRGPRGCTKGKSCERFHPKMCSSSINHAECLNATCSLYHVKGTRRLNSKPRSHEEPSRNHNRASDRGSYQTRDNSHRESTQHHPKPVLQQDFLDMFRILKQEIVEAIRAPPHYPPLQNQLPVVSHPNPTMTHHAPPVATQHPPRGYTPLLY